MKKTASEQNRLQIGGISVSSSVFLGAGVIKSPLSPELASYLEEKGAIGAITIGSVTTRERDGNTGKLNWPNTTGEYDIYAREGGLHANGMRNLGIEETMNHLPKNSSKPIILSIAGNSTEEYLHALKAIVEHKNAQYVDAIEVNCSCPTMGYAPLAYSLDALRLLFNGIEKLGPTKPLWFKLSPYFTAEYFTELRERYSKYDFGGCPVIAESFMDDLLKLLKDYTGIISAIIISNGLPQVSRGADIQVELSEGVVRTVAGLSGPALKAGNIKTIRYMKANGLAVDIIGCGGVLTKQDIIDYVDSGAAAVQCVGGPIWGDGIAFFDKIIK